MNKKQEVYIGLNSQFSKTTGFSNTYIFQGTREMNALELADKAESVQTWEYGTTDEWIEQAATMLRQQQAEIEALKNNSDTISYWRYEQLAKENMWLLDQLNKLKDPKMDFSKHNRIMDKLYPNSHWEHLPKDTDK